MNYRVGDRVFVDDPEYQETYVGTVTVADRHGVVVNGPHVDSRVIQFTVGADRIESTIRPYVDYSPRHLEVLA